ncbi:unnamed protein product, partial [Oppiella nova]
MQSKVAAIQDINDWPTLGEATPQHRSQCDDESAGTRITTNGEHSPPGVAPNAWAIVDNSHHRSVPSAASSSSAPPLPSKSSQDTTRAVHKEVSVPSPTPLRAADNTPNSANTSSLEDEVEANENRADGKHTPTPPKSGAGSGGRPEADSR